MWNVWPLIENASLGWDGIAKCLRDGLKWKMVSNRAHTHIQRTETMIQTNHDGMQTPPGRESPNPRNREPNGELVLLWRLTSLIISPDDVDGQPELNEPWKCYNGQWERDPIQSNIITLGKIISNLISPRYGKHIYTKLNRLLIIPKIFKNK